MLLKRSVLHGLHVIRFQIATGQLREHVVGCYISPSNTSTVEGVAAAIRDQPYGAELLVA